jgi:hypothetical protein
MAIAGWGTADARACLAWCKRSGVLSIVMSETRSADGARVWWREWVKSRIVRRFDAGLCGGESHRRYLVELGIPEDRVAFGYNVVDNQFFGEMQNGSLLTVQGAEEGEELTTEDTESTEEGKAEHPRGSAEPKGKTNVWPREGTQAARVSARETAEGGPAGARRVGTRESTFRSEAEQKLKDEGTTKHTNLHESGERGAENFQPLITQIDTDKGREAGLCLAGQAGAAFSNPSTSELARDSENTSPISSAVCPASLPATSYSPPVTAPKALYFLASCRFIRRKNVETLIQAYYLYSTLCKSEIWPLVLLGEGELKGELVGRARELQMRVWGGGGAADGGSLMADSGSQRSEIGDRVGTTKDTNHTNFLTTDSTDSTDGHNQAAGRPLSRLPQAAPQGRDEWERTSQIQEAGHRPDSRAGASESDSLASKLADSPVSESLTHSASIPAEAAKPPRTEDEGRRPDGTEGANVLESASQTDAGHLRSEWSGDFEGPSSSLLGSGTAKTLPAQELGMPVSASSSVLISDISGKKKSGSLDSGRWPLDSAPKALPGWAQGLVDLYPDFSGKGLVVFAGFRQLEELPEIYHGAGAFIHPALEEPWGLVINEAMASGLPILSSRNVGAAEELVSEADNGFLFDPKDAYQIARYMGLISRLPLEERLAMGEKSREIVEAKAPKRAFGLGLKKLLAVENFE